MKTDVERKSPRIAIKSLSRFKNTPENPVNVFTEEEIEEENSCKLKGKKKVTDGIVVENQVEVVPQRMGFYVVDMFNKVNIKIIVPCGNIKVGEDSLHNLLGVPKDGVDLLSRDAKKVWTPGVTGWRKNYDKDYITPSDIGMEKKGNLTIQRWPDNANGIVKINEMNVDVRVPPIKFWDLDRLKGREHVEVANGGFGDGIQRMLSNSFEEKRDIKKRIQFLYKKKKEDAILEVICSSYEEIYNSKPGLTDHVEEKELKHDKKGCLQGKVQKIEAEFGLKPNEMPSYILGLTQEWEEIKNADTISGEGIEDDVRIDAISLKGDETVEVLLDQKEATIFNRKEAEHGIKQHDMPSYNLGLTQEWTETKEVAIPGEVVDVTAKTFDLKEEEHGVKPHDMSSYNLGLTQEWAETKADAIPVDIESSGARTFEANPLQVDLELTNEMNPPILDKTPCTATRKQMMKKVTFLDKDDVCISLVYTKEEEVVWQYLFKEEIMVEKLKNLKQFEVIIFPLIEMNHFYIIVLDLKNPGFYLIDNMDPDETVVSMRDHNEYYKKDTPYKVHPMTKELKKATIVRLGLKWAIIGNITDCGVFAMRHMEMVWSNCHTSFNCGFSTSQEEQRKQIEALRKKYASRIILSNINKLRMNVIDSACV
ncbi:hypothetical protein E3N88_32598 [Mikania micrantha]|uniref:Ubiquitin-like protease family profile domain-containing protein n=1 Tax=Mikania micrantha TaxID=192012 RepID=A0A5N6MBI6_9ASTR|nr:hypothetical protein E3N88_32598 [Mikania micrantha]